MTFRKTWGKIKEITGGFIGPSTRALGKTFGPGAAKIRDGAEKNSRIYKKTSKKGQKRDFEGKNRPRHPILDEIFFSPKLPQISKLTSRATHVKGRGHQKNFNQLTAPVSPVEIPPLSGPILGSKMTLSVIFRDMATQKIRYGEEGPDPRVGGGFR